VTLFLGRLAAANAWVGTAGTVTHLHTDQADNLLCQVAGYKLVRVLGPGVAKRRVGVGLAFSGPSFGVCGEG
jgi:hypothetical protein